MSDSIQPDPDEDLATGWEPHLPVEDTLVRQAAFLHASWLTTVAKALGRPRRQTDDWAGAFIADRGALSNPVVLLRPPRDLGGLVAEVSEVDGRTYVVSGAGGKLREEVPERFEEAHTTAWAAQAHLLLVEIDRAEARLTPVSGLLPDGSLHLMTALTKDNAVVRPPIIIGQPKR